MKTQSQRDAVYAAIKSVLKDNDVAFDDGGDVTEVLSTEMRKSCQTILCEGFKGGTIEFENTPSNQEKLASDSKLKQYVSGLLSNWIRKDKRFNGDVQYVAKNPGSRAGAGDETLKTMRALAKKFAGTDKAEAIQKHISNRVAEIAASKTKEVTLTEEQISKLDPALRAMLGI
jgi:hypothetical protein